MRRLSIAIGMSILSHATALAWIARDGVALPAPHRAVTATAAPPPAPLRIEPIDVVLFDAPDEGAPDEGAPATRAAISAGVASRPEQGRSEPALSRGAPGRGGPIAESGPSPWMTMRRREAPPIAGLSSDLVERFLSRTRPVPPPPDIPGERIAEQLAEVRRQMRYARQHHPDRVEALRLEAIALTAQRDAEELKPSGGGTYRTDKQTFTAKVDRDGRAHLEDKRERLDAQDEMMLRRGIDPYARNKLEFLDRTRDQRAAVGERHRRDQLAHAAQLMQRNIDRLWAMTSELAARKAELFELWDDCAETGAAELVEAAAAARAVVVGAIRARLRGSDAYTAAELAQLNARRRSSAAFSPYE